MDDVTLFQGVSVKNQWLSWSQQALEFSLILLPSFDEAFCPLKSPLPTSSGLVCVRPTAFKVAFLSMDERRLLTGAMLLKKMTALPLNHCRKYLQVWPHESIPHP